MLLIIIGLALILLDIAIAPSETVMIIELLPDFIGYGLVLLGIRREKEYAMVFHKAMLISLCGTVAGAVLYGMKALGFAGSAAMTILLLEVFELILMVILVFMITRSFKELGQDLQLDMKGKPLFYLWLCHAVAIIASYIFQTEVAIYSLASLLSDVLAMVILFLLYTNYQKLREE